MNDEFFWGLPDWTGVDDPWVGSNINLDALHDIVCQVLRVPKANCGPAVWMNPYEEGDLIDFARVYSFQTPSKSVLARVIAPLKPLFKTEGEVAAMDMDLARSRTSLPVPHVFAYCSEASNPIGAEWVLMAQMPGSVLKDVWEELGLFQKQRLALDLVDIYDQLYHIKADGIGGIYHAVTAADDSGLMPKTKLSRSLRWAPLSPESLQMLRSLCNHHIKDGYELGPLNDISLVDFWHPIPPPLNTPPSFTSEDYVKLIALNGIPTTRSRQ